MTFEQCITHIAEVEGEFTINPKDKGNYTPSGVLKGTKYGISAKSYPNLDIKNLTKDKATELYKKDYWNKAKIDLLPSKIRLQYFDTAVNSGISTATKLLQRVLGVKDDGIIGDITRSRLQNVTIEEFAKQRNNFYVNIVKKDNSQLTFLQGWLNRNLKITIISLKNEF